MPELDNLLADLASGDDARAESAISGLLALGAAPVPALVDMTRSKDTDSRWWAVRALAQSPHARTEDLLPLLNDPASEVRAAAALAVCSHPDEMAVPALVKSLSDEDSLTAGLAAKALVAVGSPAVPALIEVIQGAKNGVRILAIRALAELKDHRAIKTMMSALEDESAVVQYWAKEGLDRLGLNMVYGKP
jgi:HEAT repeat protein